jgi:uncharacterized protein DUF4145
MSEILERLPDEVTAREGLVGDIPLARFYETEYRLNKKRLHEAYWDLLLWDLSLSDKQRLFLLPLFEPDLWLARHREIGPFLLERKTRNVPSHVRRRVREVQNAFVVGNFLAAVALARSILEYALIDRAASLGYEPYESYMGKRRVNRLGDLVEAASNARPIIGEAMEHVREIGNRVLHPRKDYDVIGFPNLLERDAFDCIRAIREVLVELYRG